MAYSCAIYEGYEWELLPNSLYFEWLGSSSITFEAIFPNYLPNPLNGVSGCFILVDSTTLLPQAKNIYRQSGGSRSRCILHESLSRTRSSYRLCCLRLLLSPKHIETLTLTKIFEDKITKTGSVFYIFIFCPKITFNCRAHLTQRKHVTYKNSIPCFIMMR